jgi:hypothetical protein
MRRPRPVHALVVAEKSTGTESTTDFVAQRHKIAGRPRHDQSHRACDVFMSISSVNDHIRQLRTGQRSDQLDHWFLRFFPGRFARHSAPRFAPLDAGRLSVPMAPTAAT